MFKFLKIFTGMMAATIGLMFLLWVYGFIIFTGLVSSMNEPKEIEKTDAIIVLTGGTNRIDRALDLLSEGKTDHLFVSGVNKSVKLKELLSTYRKPLPDCCINLGYEADNTLGNAIETRKWVEANNIKTIRLITATYHMQRSLLEFHHALPDIKIIPHPVIPGNFSPDEEKFWKLCFLEYHKLLLSFVRVVFYPAEIHPMPETMK